MVGTQWKGWTWFDHELDEFWASRLIWPTENCDAIALFQPQSLGGLIGRLRIFQLFLRKPMVSEWTLPSIQVTWGQYRPR
jgi:hypothetical protein